MGSVKLYAANVSRSVPIQGDTLQGQRPGRWVYADQYQRPHGYCELLFRMDYCYANKNAQLPRENFALHDPESPLLIGHLKPADRLEDGAQKTFLVKSVSLRNEKEEAHD